MRTTEEVAEVLELKASGLGAYTIAKRTGIPRSTVRDWLAERAPAPRQAPSNELPAGAGPAYVYLLGVYLGDGCISEHRRHVFRMRLHLDLRYPGIVDECEAAVARVAPSNTIGRRYLRSRYTGREEPTYVEVSCYSKRWPALFPQHGPGRKHERKIELADWQRKLVQEHPRMLLRGLVHSDGCRNINTGTNWRNPRYSFSNRSDDIRSIFCWACDLLELHWTTAPNTVYVSRKADVARMDEFIGPKA